MERQKLKKAAIDGNNYQKNWRQNYLYDFRILLRTGGEKGMIAK